MNRWYEKNKVTMEIDGCNVTEFVMTGDVKFNADPRGWHEDNITIEGYVKKRYTADEEWCREHDFTVPQEEVFMVYVNGEWTFVDEGLG